MVKYKWQLGLRRCPFSPNLSHPPDQRLCYPPSPTSHVAFHPIPYSTGCASFIPFYRQLGILYSPISPGITISHCSSEITSHVRRSPVGYTRPAHYLLSEQYRSLKTHYHPLSVLSSHPRTRRSNFPLN